MEEGKPDPLVEMKTLSVKLEDLEAQMTEITLRLGRIPQRGFEAEAKNITELVGNLARRLNTTATD